MKHKTKEVKNKTVFHAFLSGIRKQWFF